MDAAKPAEWTLAAAVDISKAFDIVPRYGLIAKLMDTAIHPNYIIWLGISCRDVMPLLNSDA